MLLFDPGQKGSVHLAAIFVQDNEAALCSAVIAELS